MRCDQLEHVIRAAAVLADDPDVVVVGSQAILGTASDAPARAGEGLGVRARSARGELG